jgi:hypothetical protein
MNIDKLFYVFLRNFILIKISRRKPLNLVRKNVKIKCRKKM